MVESTKKGRKTGSCYGILTTTEREVLYLHKKEFLTAKQISIRRKTSLQATYKILSSLKKKGALSNHNYMVEKTKSTIQPYRGIRLHGEEYNIKIIHRDERYKQILSKCNILTLDGHTIRLYRDSLEIYGKTSFYGESVNKAHSKSVKYWSRFMTKLEYQLKIVILKAKKQNIKLVNSHYAEYNNELAEECEKKAQKIRVYAKEDGKLWFTIDNSYNLGEAENLHPETSKQDMTQIVNHFNDIRNNKPPTLSEIMILMQEQIKINKDTGAGLNAVVEYIKGQLPQKQEFKDSDRPSYIG